MSIPEPSIRSTNFHGSKPASFRAISKEERADVEQIINSATGADWRISSLVDLRRDYSILTDHVLWVWQRRASNLERSGFLLLRTNGTCVFWNSMKNEMVSMRIQIPHGFCSHDTYWLCTATLCNSENSLEIEDIIVANGVQIFNVLTYAQRFSLLKQVVSHLSNQPYLGVSIKGVMPIGLGEWLKKTAVYGFQPDDGSVWDIQPNDVSMKRKVWIAPKKIIEGPKQINTVVLGGIEALAHMKGVTKNHNPLVRPQAAPSARYAYVITDKMGPDRYLLMSVEREQVGYALVRGLLESEKYRQEISSGANIARIVWVPEFNKYKMVELLCVKSGADAAGMVSSRAMFHEV
jgi:hypothetical protein